MSEKKVFNENALNCNSIGRLSMKTRHYLFFLFGVALVLLVLPNHILAASYCDRVRTGDLKDPNLLLCEDFEAPTLIQNTGVGNGAPYYGPWYDDSGRTGDRGFNSYWNRRYGNGTDGFLWHLNEPTSPTLGRPCTAFSACTGAKVWEASNLWSANSLVPYLLIPHLSSDFSAEIKTLSAPTNAAGGGSGVFDGNASLAYRIPNGTTNFGAANGIAGVAAWSRVTTFGATMAVAYPTNLGTSGVLNANWKHNEWVYNVGQAGGDGLFLFGEIGSLSTTFPFYGFVFGGGAGLVSACNTALAAATKTTGTFQCDGNANFLFRASSSDYSRPTDWPLGTWGCVEGYYQGMGTTKSAIQIWFTGPAGVRKKLVDISGMDLTQHTAGNGGTPGYVGLSWNGYANANQEAATVTKEVTFRYEDNIHIRAGAPVSCAQIGYQSGSATVPNSPSGLFVQ